MKTRGCTRKSEKGFSLAELLLVLALIVVVLSLAMPVFQNTRLFFKKTKCVANLQALTKGIALYRSDHGGRLPPNKSDPPATAASIWTTQIAPYLGCQQTTNAGLAVELKPFLLCPAAIPPATWEWWDSYYGVNASGPSTFGFDGTSHIPKINDYSRTMQLIEMDANRSSRPTSASLAKIDYRHQAKVNVAFFDGHIEQLSREQIPTSSGSTFWSGQ